LACGQTYALDELLAAGLGAITNMSIATTVSGTQVALFSQGNRIMAVKTKPDGCRSVTPYLVVDGAARLIDFLKDVFNAEEVERFAGPGDRIAHAELRIGDSLIMLGDGRGEHPASQATLYLFVDDVDETFRAALSAGASVIEPPRDHFYGDRSGGVIDPWGNIWHIATHIKDVPQPELTQRVREAMASAAGN